MSKAQPKPRKNRAPKVASADLPAAIDPRTPEEAALVSAWKDSPRLAHPPKFETGPKGKMQFMSADKELASARLDRVFCGVDPDHTRHLITLIAGTLGISDHVGAINTAVAMVHAIGPRDPVESILASQMVATNDVAMEMLRRARIPEQPSEIVDECVLCATRLMRTFTAQEATLKDYRSKGHQTVTVQHVDVRDGGQAIVGKDVVLKQARDPGGWGIMTETAKRIPRGRGGQPGNQNAYKHGRFTAQAKAERAWVRWLLRQSRAHLKVTRELAEVMAQYEP